MIFAKKNNIELILFMTPTYITTYLSDDINNLNRFKYKIAQVTDFYDFSIINDVTKNKYYWHDGSHFNIEVSKKIIDVLRVNKNAGEFMVHVKRNNAANHCRNMVEKRSNYINNSNNDF